MLSFLWLIGGLVILGIIAPMAFDAIPNYIHKKWLAYKYPDYDRTLTSLETNYIEGAQRDILNLSQDQTVKKKSSGTLYVFAFIPIAFVAWALLWWIGFSINNFLNQRAVASDDVIATHVIGFGVSGVMAVFAGGAFAFWLLYLIVAKPKGEDNLNICSLAGIPEKKKDEILNGILKLIEHDVRIKRLDTNAPFSAMHFLKAMNRRHQKYTGYAAYIFMGMTCIFFIFDMRDRTTFFKDHIVFTAYWSGKKTTIPYSDLNYVEAECAFGHRDGLDLSLGYYVEENRIAHIGINNWVKANGLERLSKLDSLMREHRVPVKKSTRQPIGRDVQSAYLRNCFEKLSGYSSNERFRIIRKILHADELEAD